jgi:hypothetical protein
VTENRRTRITIESEHILIVAKREITRGWCERCGLEVELVNRRGPECVSDVLVGELRKASQDRLSAPHTERFLAACLRPLLRLLRAARNRSPSRSKEI